MREIYHDELDTIGRNVIEMTNLVAHGMDRATQALLDSNLAVADEVIADDAKVNALRDEMDERCFQIIAQQQPVATDLRVVIATMHLVADLERMGDLVVHIAQIARMRFPDSAVPAETRDIIEQMGQVASSLITKVAEVVDGRDVELAEAVVEEDDSMDALRRKLYTIVMSPNWSRGAEAAVDMALLGRYYERYADHAVAVAGHTIFIVTGRHPHD